MFSNLNKFAWYYGQLIDGEIQYLYYCSMQFMNCEKALGMYNVHIFHVQNKAHLLSMMVGSDDSGYKLEGDIASNQQLSNDVSKLCGKWMLLH